MKKHETKKEEEVKDATILEVKLTEKQELEIVHQFMKDHGINSIGDIENKIARL